MKHIYLILIIALFGCNTDSNDQHDNPIKDVGTAVKEVKVTAMKGPFPIANGYIYTPDQALAKQPDGWKASDSSTVKGKSDFEFSVPENTTEALIRIDGAFLNEFSQKTEDVTDANLFAFVNPDSTVAVNMLTHMIVMCIDTRGGYSLSAYSDCEEQVLQDFGVGVDALEAGYRDDAGLGVLLGVSNIATYSEDYSIFRDSTRSVMRYDRYFEDLVLGVKDTSSDVVQTAEIMASDSGLIARCDIAVDNLTDSIYINVKPLVLSNDSAVRADCKQYVTEFAYGFKYNDSTMQVLEWVGSEDYDFFKAYKTDPQYIEMCGHWNDSFNGLVNHFGCWEGWLEIRNASFQTSDS